MGWQVSEIGYGTWGLGGDWKGATDADAAVALQRAIELGCNFFDTAWAYGRGHSERMLGASISAFPDRTLYVASKIPPKNFKWPAREGAQLDDCFPPDHIREYTERSLRNLGVSSIDLMQFHVWRDAWARDERWQRAVDDLKHDGLIRAIGISVHRWEPESAMEALRTGLIDAVQVIYNIFDQAAEDALFPLCQKLDIAVIARVPFDEGTLTGKLSHGQTWEKGDWRSKYFTPRNLEESLARVEALRPLLPGGMTMAEMALHFILAHPAVSTVIPGMRRRSNVEANMAVGGVQGLSGKLITRLRLHRWDRTPDYLSTCQPPAGLVRQILSALRRVRAATRGDP